MSFAATQPHRFPPTLAGRIFQRRFAALFAIVVLGFCGLFVSGLTRRVTWATTPSTPKLLARLNDRPTMRRNSRDDAGPNLSLREGRTLLSRYEGRVDLQRALTENEAAAQSLASADFDEDGVPDLAGGYSYLERGIVTIHRGNVDSIYPYAPEAHTRRANGSFTAAPFLSPALAIDVPVAADYLAAGDFDADGHWDIVLVNRGGGALYFLPGDGQGNFAAPREVSVSGSVTAFAAGEVNRRDGLTDLVVATVGPRGAQL